MTATTSTTRLTGLSLADVVGALENSGYFENDLRDREFIRFTSNGDAAYVVGFLDDEGKRDTGYVYVSERDGKLFGEF